MTRLTTDRHQPGLGRPARRARRAARAGRGLPPVESVEHGTRPAAPAAEIAQVDLAGFVLELAVWGRTAACRSSTRPPAKRRRQAGELLSRSAHSIGRRGHRSAGGWSTMPVHPAWPGWSPTERAAWRA